MQGSPGRYSSAAAREQGIGRDGNGRGRAAMRVRAWPWPRGQPDSSLSAWFRERIGKVGGRIKKIMIVALPRKLLIALWRYAKDGVIPEGAKMKTAWKRHSSHFLSGPRPAVAVAVPGPARAPFLGREPRHGTPSPECRDHGQGSRLPPDTGLAGRTRSRVSAQIGAHGDRISAIDFRAFVRGGNRPLRAGQGDETGLVSGHQRHQGNFADFDDPLRQALGIECELRDIKNPRLRLGMG
jgi:hypothetical protein